MVSLLFYGVNSLSVKAKKLKREKNSQCWYRKMIKN